MKIFTIVLACFAFSGFLSCKDEKEDPIFDVMYRVKGTSRVHKITYKDKDGNWVTKDSIKDHWEHGFFTSKDAHLSITAQNLDSAGSIITNITINGNRVQEGMATSPYGIATAEARVE